MHSFGPSTYILEHFHLCLTANRSYTTPSAHLQPFLVFEPIFERSCTRKLIFDRLHVFCPITITPNQAQQLYRVLANISSPTTTNTFHFRHPPPCQLPQLKNGRVNVQKRFPRSNLPPEQPKPPISCLYPPSDSIPILPSSASPPSTSINFETFIELADLGDVLRFCDAITWDRAFEAGLDQGRNEERDFRDEMYLRGKACGIREAEAAARRAEIDLYSHGIEKGRTEEQTEWTSAGHGPHCFSPVAILSDQIIQTNSEPPSHAATTTVSVQTSTVSRHDASAQASEPPPSLSQPQKTTTALLDWAEEANSLPITPLLPSLHPPRDLSVLRSSSSSPFSSLQHCSKRFTNISRQLRRHHSRFNFNSFYSPHHNSYKPSQPHFHTKTYSHLNWESDPHLSDLSHSLKALGWIRAH